MTRVSLATLVIVSLNSSLALASAWNVVFRDSLSLDTSIVGVSELSGVTYLGPSSTVGKHEFAAVQDGGGVVITIEAEFDASANLISAATVSSLSLANTLDFEGIAYTGDALGTLYISEENNPGVREYDPNNGSFQQALSIPSVFSNRRGNRGFESLSRSADGSVMWTANEEALTVDGDLSTPTTGSTVRLLQFEQNGSSYDPGSQYAYVTEPLHGGVTSGSRSGLSDLVVLPDGTLLALERSAAVALPPFLSSIYEVDFAAATDISTSNYAAGLLVDPNYTSVGKELLWAGAADGGFGVNLEGLALGPRLDSGNWVLFGVSDDSSSNSSTITTWELSANPDADFNRNGEVEGQDFLAWQRGSGIAVGASFGQGDADRDGDVDAEDLANWRSNYATLTASAQAVPESSAWLLLIIGANIMGLQRRSRGFP